MNWLNRIMPKIKEGKRAQTPEGIWLKCDDCGQTLYRKEVENNLHVCTQCGAHFRIGATERIDVTLDPEGREELFADWSPKDPLKFKDSKPYKGRLKEAQKKTDGKDGALVFKGTVKGVPVVVAAFDFNFMGGSMGSVVGGKVAAAALAAEEAECGFITFSTSGGARMQEGILSLMQMAKTSAALTALEKAKLPFISVLTDPTTGGVTASFAMLGDLILAEPKALICFAGPRVIEQTIRETLPEGFQRSEYLLEHGFVDKIVHRGEMRDVLADLLSRLTGARLKADAAPAPEPEETDAESEAPTT